jgi:hypothetical protein
MVLFLWAVPSACGGVRCRQHARWWRFANRRARSWRYHLVGNGGAQPHRLPGPQGAWGAIEQRDAADEGRLDAYGTIVVGNEVIVNQGKVVRPSQLIASVRQTERSARDTD